MNRPDPTPPWSVPIAVADIPEGGQHLLIAADAPTRAAVARAAGVNGLVRLEAEFTLARHGSDGVRVSGVVRATAEQTCVVTLEPMQSDIDEAIDLLFVPEPALYGRQEGDAGPEEADELPERLVGGTVDLGAVATEFLILGVDLYPRKPGAVFEPPVTGAAAPGPFAALSALQKRRGGPRE
jgi:hypothetical protein